MFAQVFDTMLASRGQERGSLKGRGGKEIAVFGIFLDIVPDSQVDPNSPLREIFAAMSGLVGEGGVSVRLEFRTSPGWWIPSFTSCSCGHLLRALSQRIAHDA